MGDAKNYLENIMAAKKRFKNYYKIRKFLISEMEDYRFSLHKGTMTHVDMLKIVEKKFGYGCVSLDQWENFYDSTIYTVNLNIYYLSRITISPINPIN